jgi:hypothetical protein
VIYGFIKEPNDLTFAIALDRIKYYTEDNPFVKVQPKITSHDDLLTDDRPVFDLLNHHAALEWRKGYLRYLLPLYEQNKIPLIL